MAAMRVERRLPRKEIHNNAGKQRAQDEVLLDLVHRSFDKIRLIARHQRFDTRRQELLNINQALLDRFDRGYRVRPGLFAMIRDTAFLPS